MSVNESLKVRELIKPNIDLYNGNCLDIMDKLIEQGVTVDAIITDPPY